MIIEKEEAIEDLKEKYRTLSETIAILEEENEKLKREVCVREIDYLCYRKVCVIMICHFSLI